MYEDVIGEIKFAYNTFTNVEKKIADYVLANPQKVIYMSISELANECEVGDTSVFRFCRHINKKGYMDFKMALAQVLSTKENSELEGERGTLYNLAQMSINHVTDSLKETLNMTGPKVIEDVALAMHKAQRVFFFGAGSSMASAYEGYSRFMRVSPKMSFDFDSHMQCMHASLLHKNDVVIAFSYLGATKDTISCAKIAKKAGATVVAITHFSSSELTNLCDYVLLCGANENPSRGGSFSAKITQLFLLDLLYNEYVRVSSPESEVNRKKSMSAISDKLL